MSSNRVRPAASIIELINGQIKVETIENMIVLIYRCNAYLYSLDGARRKDATYKGMAIIVYVYVYVHML